MVKSTYVFDEGEPIDVGSPGSNDFVLESGEQVTDDGVSGVVFEAGTGLRGTTDVNSDHIWPYIFAIGGNGSANAEYYDVENDMWVTVSPPPAAHYGGAAANIDGTIYVAGGADDEDRFSIYDVSSDSWSTGPSMPTPRRFHGGDDFDGVFYCISGTSTTSVRSTANEGYTPGGSWSSFSEPAVAQEGTRCVSQGEYIYLIGGDEGSTTTTANRGYAPRTDSWATLQDIPYGVETQAVTSYDGDIYIFGGYDFTTDNETNKATRYNVGSNSWESLTPMPTARFRVDCEVGIDGRIYVIGGEQAPTTVEAYDPVADSWDTSPSNSTYGHDGSNLAGADSVP